jgi:IS605 OrfB family transposase
VRTVVLAYRPGEPLLRALRDVRSAVNQLVPDWRAHPEETRFEVTRRSYRELRPRYGHLASTWSVVACNESSATLRCWDKMLRRARRHDPEKFEKLRNKLPHRRNLKASLGRDLYRIRDSVLDITINPDQHVSVDLSTTQNPLFWRYLLESQGRFGLAVTDRKLIFNFRIPHDQRVVPDSVGIDLNMPTADLATSDGAIDSVDLTGITRIQGAMARKRDKIKRKISKDQHSRDRVLGRYRGRERNRVTPLLHQAANELLAKVGNRNIIFEDLTGTTEELLKDRARWKNRKNPEVDRRRLSAWTHGRLQQIVSYKSNTAVLQVNPRGTSSECPQCGGVVHHPSWRRSDCVNCQSSWHRDRAAAIVILSRGLEVLRGAAPPPRARDALREAAAWRPGVDDESDSGPTTPPTNGDDAKSDNPESGSSGMEYPCIASARALEGPGPRMGFHTRSV